MKILEQIVRGIRRRQGLIKYLFETAYGVQYLARTDQYLSIPGYLLVRFFGNGVFLRRHPDGLIVTKNIFDFKMQLDLTSSGISKTLFQYGVREETAIQTFREELNFLAQRDTDRLTVLEIGANIGLFALTEAEMLKANDRIIAIEPNPHNVELLRLNASQNGYIDRIEIHQTALGSYDGTGKLAINADYNSTGRSNNSVLTDTISPEATIDTKVRTPSEFLRALDIKPFEINVLRMDVEGYEQILLPQLKSILESDQELLVYIELHVGSVTRDKMDNLCLLLKNADLGIVSASGSRKVALASDTAESWYRITGSWGERKYVVEVPHNKTKGYEYNVNSWEDIEMLLDKMYSNTQIYACGIELICRRK